MVSNYTKAESDNAVGFSLICFKLVLLLSGYETKRSLEKNKPKLSLTCIIQIVKSVSTCPEQTRHQLKQGNSAALLTCFQFKYTRLPSAALLRPDRQQRHQLCAWSCTIHNQAGQLLRA